MKGSKNRAEMVKAMDLLARSVNNEEYLEPWLMCGVADGDITSETTLQEIIELGYTDDDTYNELTEVFLRVMSYARKDGGLA